MPSPNVSIHLDDAKVRAMLAKAPVQVEQTVHRLLEKAGIETMAQMRTVAPVGATGDLRRTAHYFFLSKYEMAVEPTAPYAEAVEKGSRPHTPPIQPLMRWANLKGIPVWAVAMSIKLRGTKPHPFVAPTYDIMKPRVEAMWDSGIAQLIAELND